MLTADKAAVDYIREAIPHAPLPAAKREYEEDSVADAYDEGFK